MTLLAPLLAAIGGRDRITAVRTYFREVIRATRSPTGGFEERERILTYRAAGGRIRIETWTLPAKAHDGEAERQPASGEDLPTSVVCIPGPGAGDGPVALLARNASLEPRILLAHLDERAHQIRQASGGGVEIELADERILYRFSAVTSLCELRGDARMGMFTRFLNWRTVDGIATPFLEVHESIQGGGAPSAPSTSGVLESVEERVVRVEYDLPLPDRMFGQRIYN